MTLLLTASVLTTIFCAIGIYVSINASARWVAETVEQYLLRREIRVALSRCQLSWRQDVLSGDVIVFDVCGPSGMFHRVRQTGSGWRSEFASGLGWSVCGVHGSVEAALDESERRESGRGNKIS